MRINSETVGNLNGALSNIISNAESNIAARVDLYVTTINGIWCSNKSKSFSQRLYDLFGANNSSEVGDSAKQMIEKIFQSLTHNLNAIINSHNESQNEDVPRIANNYPTLDLSQIIEGTNNQFEDGSTGIEEGHTIGELRTPISMIGNEFLDIVSKVESLIETYNIFASSSSSFQATLTGNINTVKTYVSGLIEGFATAMEQSGENEDTILNAVNSCVQTAIDNVNVANGQ